MPAPTAAVSDGDSLETVLGRTLKNFVDAEWYCARYPDIAAAKLDPLLHFIRYGAAEQRDPNGFFESAWYAEHYPDVAASGLTPLLHYLTVGAAETRNPHPKFDAAYYVEQHPDAAANPLLYHLRVGLARGFQTEKLIDIGDYLPSTLVPLVAPASRPRVAAVIVANESIHACIDRILADEASSPDRIIVVDDRLPTSEITRRLKKRVAAGQIELLSNRRHLGFSRSVAVGIKAAAKDHDVVLLSSDAEVPNGWLQRLAAHAYDHPDTATVSPFCNIVQDTTAEIDAISQTTNAGRSVKIASPMTDCIYIRHDTVGKLGALDDLDQRAVAAGWHHRLACDICVHCGHASNEASPATDPFRFALTAALMKQSKLPVILMISHNLGGGVRRHIDSLTERYHQTALILLLEGTDRGAELSILSWRAQPVLKLPYDRVDDLAAVLRSMNVSRLHLHHLLRMNMDIRALIGQLRVPFDVTVHDYFALCPQINLLMRSEEFYCGEPRPAICNACIADRSSHGSADIVSWRLAHAWLFLEADRVICPSADAKTRLDRYGLGGRALVVSHEAQLATHWIANRPKFDGPPLRIALLGVLANHKGARTVAAVAEAAAPGTIELHLIGHLEDSFPESALHLIETTGKYLDRDLPDLLQRSRPHVFWFPSSCPETYSYTLSTAIETGLPIVAVELGSFPERLAGRPDTWLINHRAEAAIWLSTFDEVRATLLDRAPRPPVRRPRQHADFYANRYLSPRNPPARRDRRPRIAILPERFNGGGLTPCAYIRLLQPLAHPLIAAGADVILTNADTVLSHDVDVIITQRYAVTDPGMAGRLAAHARRTGAKLLFDLDDDLLSIPSSHPDGATLRPRARSVRRMLTVADAIWVSTPALAERLATVRPDAVVVENGLDERIWVHQPEAPPFWDTPVRILCMGTTTHAQDYALIEPALVRLQAEYGDLIAIDILGMTSRELPPGLNRIGPSAHGSQSYPGFVNWLTSRQPRWHIGLAPLLDTPFNRCKSALKAMDYAALGLTVLASDMPVYRGSIADGLAGQLVANDPTAWHAALDWLIRDQNLQRLSAASARQAFATRGTLASQAAARRATLVRLLPDRPQVAVAALRHREVAVAALRRGAAPVNIADVPTDHVTRKGSNRARGR